MTFEISGFPMHYPCDCPEEITVTPPIDMYGETANFKISYLTDSHDLATVGIA